MVHGRILCRHDTLRHNRDHRHVYARDPQFAFQCLLQDVSNLALGTGVTYVQRVAWNLTCSALRTKQRRAYLRTIPMGENDSISSRAKTNNFTCSPARIRHLLRNAALLTSADERIAADRQQNGFHLIRQ